MEKRKMTKHWLYFLEILVVLQFAYLPCDCALCLALESKSSISYSNSSPASTDLYRMCLLNFSITLFKNNTNSQQIVTRGSQPHVPFLEFLLVTLPVILFGANPENKHLCSTVTKIAGLILMSSMFSWFCVWFTFMEL